MTSAEVVIICPDNFNWISIIRHVGHRHSPGAKSLSTSVVYSSQKSCRKIRLSNGAQKRGYQNFLPRRGKSSKTNISSPKRDYFNRKYIFQLLIFRGHSLVFRGVTNKKHMENDDLCLEVSLKYSHLLILSI